MNNKYLDLSIRLARKTYNFLYKTFPFVSPIEIIKVLFQKEKITTSPPDDVLTLDKVLPSSTEMEMINAHLENDQCVVLGTFFHQRSIASNFDLKIKNRITKKISGDAPINGVIELVVLPGKVIAIKKNHVNYTAFFRELYAIAALSKTDVRVPLIYDFDLHRKSILMEFINENDAKTMIGLKGASAKEQELMDSEIYRKSSKVSRYYKRVEIQRSYLHKVFNADQLQRIFSDYELMLKEKFIYQDIKYGNIILCKGKIYWIDFEDCKRHSYAPGFIFRNLSEIYSAKLRRHFGT